MKSSVIITTFNGEKYIYSLLFSILNQTRKPDEVLIFDDGSSDNTLSIIEEFIKNNSLKNWRLNKNRKNLGWQKNFYQGIASAKNQLIFPCDQDDVWEKNKIEDMAYACEKNPDIWLLVSDYTNLIENNAKPSIMPPILTEDEAEVSKIKFDKFYNVNLRPGCTMCINHNLLQYYQSFWEEGMPHDLVLWVLASLTNKLYYEKKSLIKYRRHGDNESKNISHNLFFKISNINIVLKANSWYLSSNFYNENNGVLVKRCFCFYQLRKELIINRKLEAWFKLFKWRSYYPNRIQYLGDLYYYFKGKTKN